ncbi:MAG: hypothetical protein JWP44_745 [Mucilaginibacter sp.]|nr:hypothetical protein [Mucilaginibacter sp.]
MTTFHLNQFKTVLVCGLFLIFHSCTVVPGSWKNEKINTGKRDDFHLLNSRALKYLKANDPKGLKALLSKDMLANNNERQVELISNRLNDNLYELLDEYYVVHKFKDTDTVRSVGGQVNRYNLLYPYAAMEMYCAYFIPKKPDNKYMLSIIYAKFNYGWKIIKLDVAPYTINGKTAPELYALARQQYDKNHVQAALNNVELAVTCFKPGSYWQYPDELDAGKFYARVHTEVNQRYRYPLVLSQLASGPMILRIYTKNGDDGTYPMVYYMTHYNLNDTTAVKKENVQIRNAVSKLMPGLDENNKYIYYSAFNKMPTGYSSVDHFDMMQKVR